MSQKEDTYFYRGVRVIYLRIIPYFLIIITQFKVYEYIERKANKDRDRKCVRLS